MVLSPPKLPASLFFVPDPEEPEPCEKPVPVAAAGEEPEPESEPSVLDGELGELPALSALPAAWPLAPGPPPVSPGMTFTLAEGVEPEMLAAEG